jgi:hypothetical protein
VGPPLDPRPFSELSGEEQLYLKRAEEFVRRWNALQKGTPLARIPATWKKPAGRPTDMSP